MKIHELKTLPEYFEDVQRQKKKAELRINDRGFDEGDILCLREYNPVLGYTGEWLMVRITHILNNEDGKENIGLHPDYAILSFEPVYVRNDAFCYPMATEAGIVWRKGGEE